MNRIDQIAAEIAELESQIAALKAEREELENADPVVTYTATDKKRIFVNGEVVYEQGGKSVKPRAKVVAVKEKDYVYNEDGTMKRNENGRGLYVETGRIIYGVKFSGVDPLTLMNQDDEMHRSMTRVWEQVVELS